MEFHAVEVLYSCNTNDKQSKINENACSNGQFTLTLCFELEFPPFENVYIKENLLLSIIWKQVTAFSD